MSTYPPSPYHTPHAPGRQRDIYNRRQFSADAFVATPRFKNSPFYTILELVTGPLEIKGMHGALTCVVVQMPIHYPSS